MAQGSVCKKASTLQCGVEKVQCCDGGLLLQRPEGHPAWNCATSPERANEQPPGNQPATTRLHNGALFVLDNLVEPLKPTEQILEPLRIFWVHRPTRV